MKKIPTLFERIFENHKVVGIKAEAHEGIEWVFKGEGYATEKIDGACCAIIDGKFYKIYDAKNGKKAPEGAIPCCDPDPITGHHPHWVRVDPFNPADKWFVEAYKNTPLKGDADGTYEAVGVHFNGNPYHLTGDTLIPHGHLLIDPIRSFEGIKDYLKEHYIEGIVFWKNGEPQCKIKRSDFGFKWGDAE